MRRSARVDANQEAVVAALRRAGVLVKSLAPIGDGFPDLLCCVRGRLVLVEVKDGSKPPSKRRLTPDQEDFHRTWAHSPLFVVETPEQALRAVGAMA